MDFSHSADKPSYEKRTVLYFPLMIFGGRHLQVRLTVFFLHQDVVLYPKCSFNEGEVAK